MRKRWLTGLDGLFLIMYLACIGYGICRSAQVPETALELLRGVCIALFSLYFIAYTIGLIFYQSAESKPSCLLKFGYILSIAASLALLISLF